MDFARAHVAKPISFWNSILFSENESKFNVFSLDERVTVWRKSNNLKWKLKIFAQP